jgi:RimJ/RimL family protein N-acetyltransferase
MTVVIRAAQPSDAAAIVALAGAVGAEPEGWLLSDRAWRTVGDERRYLRTLRRESNGNVFVAEDAGAVVGRLAVRRDAHPSSAHVANFGLMVASSHRGQGIGTALLAAAEEWARSARVSKLELHVFPHNEPAIALYEKSGYEREGFRRMHYRRPQGGFVDAIVMAKLLEAPRMTG